MKSTNLKAVRKTIDNLNQKQITFDKQKIENSFKVSDNALQIFELFCKTPEMDIATLTANLQISRQAVTKIVTKLCNELNILSKVISKKRWGTKYRYDAICGSVADLAISTTQTQNSDGLYLCFEGMEHARIKAASKTTAKFHSYKYHNNKPDNMNSENRLYVGDNLEVMKVIMPKYEGKVDLAYLDIPYNMPSTRNVQAYNNSFEGTCHLLCHLYPRLILVKRLLKQDGIIALSVSEHEEAYVKVLMDSVFKRENLVNNIVIEMAAPAGILSGFTEHKLIPVKSYLIVYAKNRAEVHFNRLYDFSVTTKFSSAFNTIIQRENAKNPLYTQILLIDYLKKQPDIVETFKKHNLAIQTNNIEKLMDMDIDFEDYVYQKLSKILFKATKPVVNPFKNDFNTPTEQIFVSNDKFYIKKKNGVVYQFKSFFNKLYENDDGELVNTNIRSDIWKGYYSEKNKIQSEGNVIFNGGKKPVKLVRDLLKWIGKKDALVLDCYAGSGTTAESLLVQNACDNGTRKFILCQIPETVNPKSEEFKAGFKTVDQITTKRIKNVIKQHPGEGFQIFK